jgi:hypothetical protein
MVTGLHASARLLHIGYLWATMYVCKFESPQYAGECEDKRIHANVCLENPRIWSSYRTHHKTGICMHVCQSGMHACKESGFDRRMNNCIKMHVCNMVCDIHLHLHLSTNIDQTRNVLTRHVLSCVYAYVNTHTHGYVCIYVCMYVCICTHTYTHVI